MMRGIGRFGVGIGMALAVFCAAAAMVPVVAVAAKWEPGSGYYILVCQEAADEGYSGDLQKFFKTSRIHYTREGHRSFGDPVNRESDTNGYTSFGDYQSGASDPTPFRNWNVTEGCGGQGVGIDHDATQPTIPASIGNPGGTGWSMAGNVNSGEGLEFRRIWLNDRIRGYRTGMPAGGLRKTISSEWLADGRSFRSCGGWGTWMDSRIMASGWKNGDDTASGWPNMSYDEDGASGFGVRWFGDPGSTAGNRYYRAGSQASGDFFDDMTGTGDDANPNGVCRIDQGNGISRYTFDTGVTRLGMRSFCNNRVEGSTLCMGTDLSLPAARLETGDARLNAMNPGASIHAQGVRIFVEDRRDPTLTLSGYLDAGGAPRGDGNPFTTEQLDYSAEDNAGIRRLRFYVDGRLQLERDFANDCDYRMPTPCLRSTGGVGPAGGVGNNFRFDVDSLQIGNHTITVEAMDGSGRTTTRVASFYVGTPPPKEEPCMTNLTAGGSIDACNTDNPTGSTDGPFGPGATVADTEEAEPTVGTGIFTYDLAFNEMRGNAALDPTNCRVIEHVASGAGGGGALSPREMNQVISITISLRGYAATGNTIGQQDLRTTFAMPSRNNPRYRGALGCPA